MVHAIAIDMNRTAQGYGASHGASANFKKIALACCGLRLAALWDTAEVLQIYEQVKGSPTCVSSVILQGVGPNGRVDVLRRMDVGFLICGAMSGCTRNILESQGITVQPWISGTIQTVLTALNQGNLADYLMPGCAGRGRCHRRGREQKQNLKGEIL